MDWRVKALLLRVASSPVGYPGYQMLQKHFGKHRTADWVVNKFKELSKMMTLIKSQGIVLDRAVICEIGTGWIPLAPIGFFLCGARTVHSIDSNAHLLESELPRIMHRISSYESQLNEIWQEVVDSAAMRERFAILRKYAHDPRGFFEAANIRLHAPTDAACTNLVDQSVDVHYSINVFEHIPPSTLLTILREAQRILRPNGVCVHFIDPSDHFSHSDSHIHSGNFLRFSPQAWNFIAGNRLAYHNRLRDRDYQELFHAAGLAVVHSGFRSDEKALKALQSGFRLWNSYKQQSPEELTRIALRYVLRSQ